MTSTRAKTLLERNEKELRIRFDDEFGEKQSLRIKKWQVEAVCGPGQTPTSYIQQAYDDVAESEPHLSLNDKRRRVIERTKQLAAQTLHLEDTEI